MSALADSSAPSNSGRRWQRVLGLLPVVALVAWAGVTEPEWAGPEGQSSPAAAPIGSHVEFRDTRIDESSGLVCSLRHPGIFWTHNDSLSAPRLYAVDSQGQTRAEIRLRDAANVDWEDMACLRRPDGSAVLLVADIGDNLHLRSAIDLYELAEPDLPPEPGREILVSPLRRWRARYPDGRHNAETLLVHPQTQRMMILTKDPSGHSRLYAFPASAKPGEVAVLELLTELNLPALPRLGKAPHHAQQTTGGAISADGRWLAVATYSYILEWALPTDGDVARALTQPPVYWQPPVTPQLEAIAYAQDGNSLWFSSERLPAGLWRMDLKR
jgi:hypothetical protein